jgi:hypothetical protein
MTNYLKIKKEKHNHKDSTDNDEMVIESKSIKLKNKYQIFLIL